MRLEGCNRVDCTLLLFRCRYACSSSRSPPDPSHLAPRTSHPMLISLILALTAATDSLMGPGVSRSLAAYRAERIAEVRYELALDVSRGDLASGRVTVRFERRGTGDLVL